MRTMCWALAIAFVVCVAAASGAQTQPSLALMTTGKLEADLGNYAKAAEAFVVVAEDAGAPSALRAEALVRLGLARSAAGDTPAALAAFTTVLDRYSSDRQTVRFAVGALASAVPGKVWGPFRNELEEILRSAEIATVVDVGVTKGSGKIVRLKCESFELRTVWRPSELGAAPHASRELAAYEMDKLLGLNMVPPVTAREIAGQRGALQYWVNGIRVFGDVKEIPKTEPWSQQLARMKLFDALLGNSLRNLNNILVDRQDNLMLIDFIAAFTNDRTLRDLPQRFDRSLIEKLRTIQASALQRFLDADAIEALLARRTALLMHVDKLVAERGEGAVFF